MFPLSTVLFPYAPLALHVFEPRYQALVADCLAGDGTFGVVLITRGSEVGGGDERAGVGTVARIRDASPLPGGRWALSTTGVDRIGVVEWLPDSPYPLARVEDRPVRDGEPSGGGAALGEALAAAVAAVRRARALLSETGRAPALAAGTALSPDPGVAAWEVCALAALTPMDAQRLLVMDGHAARLAEVTAQATALAHDLARMLAGG
ncbi:MAG: LON peptidase substrate-binding domain-containing protein [Acidimicrobiales bacterium]